MQGEENADHAVDAPLNSPPQNSALGLALPRRVEGDHVVACPVGDRLRALEQGRKKRIADIGHDDSDRLGPAGPQRLCGAIGTIAELARHLEHSRRRLGATARRRST